VLLALSLGCVPIIVTGAAVTVAAAAIIVAKW